MQMKETTSSAHCLVSSSVDEESSIFERNVNPSSFKSSSLFLSAQSKGFRRIRQKLVNRAQHTRFDQSIEGKDHPSDKKGIL